MLGLDRFDYMSTVTFEYFEASYPPASTAIFAFGSVKSTIMGSATVICERFSSISTL